MEFRFFRKLIKYKTLIPYCFSSNSSFTEKSEIKNPVTHSPTIEGIKNITSVTKGFGEFKVDKTNLQVGMFYFEMFYVVDSKLVIGEG